MHLASVTVKSRPISGAAGPSMLGSWQLALGPGVHCRERNWSNHAVPSNPQGLLGQAALRTPLLSLRPAVYNYTHLTTRERTEIQ